MALGMVTGILGAAQGIGGLFGGGGPRQPRMSGAEKQHMQSHSNMNNAMAQMMQQMTQMMRQMHQSMQGGRCGNPQGGCCQQGMNGANCCGGQNGFPQNPMGNMFGNQQPGININLPAGMPLNINVGGGQNFFPQPPFGGHFGGGVSMFA